MVDVIPSPLKPPPLPENLSHLLASLLRDLITAILHAYACNPSHPAARLALTNLDLARAALHERAGIPDEPATSPHGQVDHFTPPSATDEEQRARTEAIDRLRAQMASMNLTPSDLGG